MSDGLDRLPPQSRDAERSVLGSMLRDNAVIGDVIQILRKEDFYFDAHQKIFETITQIHDRGGAPVDAVILADALKQRAWIEDIGGYGYLVELWDAAPTAANAEYYAKIVRDKGLIRSLIHAGTEILKDAYDQMMPGDQMIESAERKILDVAEKGITGNLTTLQEAIDETYERIDKRTTGESVAFSGISTGFTELNGLTAGLQKSELVIIAARPSVGKCLAADSEIVLDDGRIVTIEEVYRRRKAQLLTLGDDWRLGWAEPSAFVDDGHKPVYRVTTRLGRRVEATASHPFLTMAGWRPLAELRAGERIAVPRRVPVFGTERLRECEVKLLGYLLGDGGLTDTTPAFTNSNPRLRADLRAAVAQFGGLRVREENLDGPRTPTLCVSADPEVRAAVRATFLGRLRTLVAGAFSSKRAFAEAVGVTPDLVAAWWAGGCVPAADVLGRIATVLGRNVEELAPAGWAVVAGKNTLTLWLRDLGLWGKGAR